jgi:hypothetical protein
MDGERFCCPCGNAAKQEAAEATTKEPLTRGVHTGYSYHPASLRSEGGNIPWTRWQKSSGLGGNIPLDWVAEIRGIRKRKHLTLRTRIKRLVRKTICFSKTTQMHDIVIGLFVNRYAFGRAV